MWARTKVVVLVFLMSLAVLPLSGFGGNETPSIETGSQEMYLLSFKSADSMRVLPAFGIELLVDYNNGYYLAKGGKFSGDYLGMFGINIQELPYRTMIRFPAAGYAFDTRIGAPAIPSDLMAVDSDEMIVQFIGPIKSEWVRAVESVGITLRDYVENFAFIAKMNPEQVEAVRSLPFVNWIGQYHPAYKIESEILQYNDVVPIGVVAHEGVSDIQLILILWRLGADLKVTWTDPVSAEATIFSSFIPALAKHPEISQIYLSPEKMPLDWQAGEIHKFHQAWDPSKSGLPTNLTGHSPGPDGIMGNADDIFEVIGIQDSGFDRNSQDDGWIDVFNGPLGDRAIRVQRRTAQCNQPDGRMTGTAHGTHVAGIIVSNGIGWEVAKGLPIDDMAWDESEAGIAPESKLSFDCVAAGGGIASSPTYWDDEYADGAKTMSNSYGSGPGPYGTTAIAIDTRINDSNDKMIIFAAGNDGPDPGSVSREAKAKNGLSIGASQNFRPDQFEADNPNLMADFSSRGDPGDRFKPDLVAIGTAVVSGLGYGEWLYHAGPGGQGVPQPSYIMEVDEYDYRIPDFGHDSIADYQYMQGTSMASPQAAGLYMLTREYFREVHGIDNVNSQLAKALLINGAVRMDQNLYEYPGIDQGWGRIDLEQSLFPPAPRSNQFEEGLFTTTGTWRPSTINMNVQTPDVPLKVTLVWIDRPGSSLIRNIDLVVKDPTQTVEYHGNQYATSGPLRGWTDPNDPGFDAINNVEQVEVNFPAPGMWNVEVRGISIPDTTKFALIFSADVGSRKEYQVNMYTAHPTIVSIAPGGTASLPFVVRNFGSQGDNISVSDNAPSEISVSLDWSVKQFLTGQSFDNMAIFSDAGAFAGIYNFYLTAESVDDPSTPKASDSIYVTVEVLDQPLPYPRKITSAAVDEQDPSVLTFNRSGVNHIFIAYRKTTPIDPADLTHGGTNVWIAHTTVNGNHEPITPWDYTEVSDWNDYPNDLRMLYIDAGTFDGRVVLTWTGQDPLETNPDLTPYGRIAFSDPPYTNWTLRTIQKNYGSFVYNSARVSFPVFRKTPAPNGTLAWVWEHLDSSSSDADAISAVQTHIAFSWDGGNSWGPCLPESDPNNRCYRIAPRGTTNYYFFPNGVVDQNDVLWVFLYWRPPAAGQGRKLAVALWDGNTWDGDWTQAINIWDDGDVNNVQFPAAVSTPEGGNRVYVTAVNDLGALDYKLFVLYAEGTYSSASPPAAAPAGGVSADFTSPQGPMGISISDSNYNRRPVLNIVYTDDGIVWIPHMEASNIYGVPNMHTYYSNDGFTTNRTLTRVTADAFAKGHQMSDTLTIGAKSCVYEVWHENIAPEGVVNYDVYLAIYCAGWENEPDNLGPITLNQATMPNPYNKTYPAPFKVKADINDISTGYHNISAAEMVMTDQTISDPSMVSWTNAWVMNLTGVNRSPTETAWLSADWLPTGWAVGECHRFWIRGQDELGNWGLGDYVDVCVTAAVAKPPTPPILIRVELTGTNFKDVNLTWARSFDDGNGVNNVLLYKIWRAEDSIYGPYILINNVTAQKRTSYYWIDYDAGHGNFHNYFYYIQANSTEFDSPSTKTGGKFFRTMTGDKQLLSIPLTQANADPMVVFQTIGFDTVRTYSPADQDRWKSYKPGRAINDINTINVRSGYWVGMTAPGTMTVAGLIPENVFITLHAGWNLIGFPSFNVTYTIAQFAAALGGVVQEIDIYDSTTGPYYLRTLPQSAWATTFMQPGIAYWIFVRATTVWAVPGI